MIFIDLEENRYTSEQVIAMGNAAELLLKDANVRSFVKTKRRELFKGFLELSTADIPTLGAEIVSAGKILNQLIEYLQICVQNRDIVINAQQNEPVTD